MIPSWGANSTVFQYHDPVIYLKCFEKYVSDSWTLPEWQEILSVSGCFILCAIWIFFLLTCSAIPVRKAKINIIQISLPRDKKIVTMHLKTNTVFLGYSNFKAWSNQLLSWLHWFVPRKLLHITCTKSI